MITKSYIEDTLKKLDTLYINSKSNKNAEYFSKLAIIELCGWIEESFDDIVYWYAKNNIKDKENIKYYENEIKKNNGFEYNNKIRPLFIKLIGIKNLENIENSLNKNGDIDTLITLLTNFKKQRDSAAHTHIKNVTRRFDAPSKLYLEWKVVYNILRKIEHEIRVLR